jgi:hypothetical protein
VWAAWAADTKPVLLEICVEALGIINDRFVGRPWQRRRADRLIIEGRVRSILFEADDGVLPIPYIDGVAEVSNKRIQMRGTELWVWDIEGEPDEGPIHPFADGKHRPSDGNLAFHPRTAIFTLRLHNGSRVRWTVLQHQADRALALLGFAGRINSEP